MRQQIRCTYLFHQGFFLKSFAGIILYKIQLFLYKRNLLNFVFLSDRGNKYRDELIRNISLTSAFVVCRSYKIANVLEKINAEIILDLNLDNDDLSGFSERELYQLMWTFVFSNSVTPVTKKKLSVFIPQDFPVKKTVIIPYNDDLDFVCDYVFQTARTLAKKGLLVHLIPHQNPISIFKRLRGSVSGIKRLNFFIENNIVTDFPVTIFPQRFLRYKQIRMISRALANYYLNLMINLVRPDYLWCFDHADFETVRKKGTSTKSIYEVMDYFTALDTDVALSIRSAEANLIKSVDYFFSSSHTLKRIKKEVRDADAVVPLGFDYESFRGTGGLSSGEQKEIQNLRKIFSKISGPVVGFIGNITYRMNFELLFSLFKRMPDVSFIFTDAFLPMPFDDKFVNTQQLISKMKEYSNVHFVPKTLSRAVIKEFLNNIDIGIIPYQIDYDFNRYCFPMKLFEYFYLGKPVVSTPIEELKRFPKYIRIANNALAWEKEIRDLLKKPWPDQLKKEQKKLALENSWENNVNKILSLISN